MIDVFMIYYQGGETVKKDGNFFRMPGKGEDAEKWDIPCNELLDFLVETYGANVLLLDVERDTRKGPDRIGDWQRFYSRDYQIHIAMMRQVWEGKKAVADKDRLISVLRDAIPKAARLRELEMEMENIMGPHTFKKWVPLELKELHVGRLP